MCFPHFETISALPTAYQAPTQPDAMRTPRARHTVAWVTNWGTLRWLQSFDSAVHSSPRHLRYYASPTLIAVQGLVSRLTQGLPWPGSSPSRTGSTQPMPSPSILIAPSAPRTLTPLPSLICQGTEIVLTWIQPKRLAAPFGRHGHVINRVDAPSIRLKIATRSTATARN
jgi:hypothetical protein